MVSTSTIASKLARTEALFPTGGTASTILLACIFHALRDEMVAREENASLIPEFTGSLDPQKHISQILQSHFAKKDDKRIFLFIDEFEEILTQATDIQRQFLSGVKELINGQLKLIHEGGTYSGRLHLILASTPYAYNRLREDIELAQIFGSFASRIRMIDLPPIDKQEAFQFLVNLLKFSYDRKLPKLLPFKSSGVLHSIIQTSQRNLRALVQLYYDLMLTAAANGEMEIIDNENVLKTFKGRYIDVFGGSTKVLDDELLTTAEAALKSLKNRGDDALNLFRLLLGEYKPFAVSELMQRLSQGEVDVHSLVSIINQEMRKIGIQRAITALFPLRSESIGEMLESLKPVENEIIFPESRIPLPHLLDELRFQDFNQSAVLTETVYLPKEANDLEILFDLTNSSAETLQRRIEPHFDTLAKNRCYIISKELVGQLYPSPILWLTDFTVDRNARRELWREALKALLEGRGELRDGLIEVINRDPEKAFQVVSEEPGSLVLKFSVIASKHDVAMPLMIYTSTTDVGVADIANLRNEIANRNPKLILLIHTGEIIDTARVEISTMREVIPLHIRPIRAQQLAALELARRQGKELNEGILSIRLREAFDELEFRKSFELWIENLRKSGNLIDSLESQFGRSDRQLADALFYYINFRGKPLSTNEVFTQAVKLRYFALYGRKRVSFAPIDIETLEELSRFQSDLILNGFLEQASSARVKVIETPVESRILELLEKKELSLEALQNRLLVLSPNEKILDQVYSQILEHKGMIERQDDRWRRRSRTSIESKIQDEFKRYENRRNKLTVTPLSTYNHVAISKEREEKIILLHEFDSYIRALYSSLLSDSVMRDETANMQKHRLLELLLDHYKEELEPLISKACNRASEIVAESESLLHEVENKIDNIIEHYNRYSEKKYSRDEIEEYRELSREFGELASIHGKAYGESELRSTLRRERTEFDFRREPEAASFFNAKVFILNKRREAFAGLRVILNTKADFIETEVRASDAVKTGLHSKILTVAVDSSNKVALVLRDNLIACQVRPLEARPSPRVSLLDIRQFFAQVTAALHSFSGQIQTSLLALAKIIEYEETLRDVTKTKSSLENLEQFFGRDQWTNELAVSSAKLQEAEVEYAALVRNASGGAKSEFRVEELTDTIRTYEERMRVATGLIADVRKTLDGIIANSKDQLDHYREQIERFIVILERIGVKTSGIGTSFFGVIEEAKNAVSKAMSSQSSTSWKTIWDDFNTLRTRLLESARESLPEDEFNALFSVVRLSEHESWVSTSSLLEDLSNTGLSPEQSRKALDSLALKGILKAGMALPV